MPVTSAQLSSAPSAPGEGDLPRILGRQVAVVVKLAERRMNLGQLKNLKVGGIIELGKRGDDALEVVVNHQVIGGGEAVKVGDNFGLRLTRIEDIRQVIRALGT